MAATRTNNGAGNRADLAIVVLRCGEGRRLEKKHQAATQELVFKDGALFYETPPSGKAPGPYCPNCKDNGGKIVLMRDNRGTGWERLAKYECPSCKASFQ